MTVETARPHRCAFGGRLVPRDGWIPDNPWDHHWGRDYPPIGCSALRCERCGEVVRAVGGVAVSAATPREREGGAAAEALWTWRSGPLPPGTGHASYLEAWDRIVRPLIDRFRPEAIVIASGYDASAFDPLGRMLATAETFGALTARAMAAADAHCDGRLVRVHEGGYSEVYVPFCGHAAIETLAGSARRAPDPMAATLATRQPGAEWRAHVSDHIGRLAGMLVGP